MTKIKNSFIVRDLQIISHTKKVQSPKGSLYFINSFEKYCSDSLAGPI